MTKYLATVVARRHSSEEYECVYAGTVLHEQPEHAENEAYENRSHPKELVKVLEVHF